MPSFIRTIALGSALAILAPVVSLSGQSPDVSLGTWKVNLAKSKYNPGPGPKSLTVAFEVAGAGIKTTASGVGADGTPIQSSYTASFDGKDYPVAGSADYDALSVKPVDPFHRIISRKKAGKVVQTAHVLFSKDGKTMTVTTTGTNAKGQKLNNVAVFDKQ